MNTTLTTDRRHDDHPPTRATPIAPERTGAPRNRVGIIDRAALHLGIALIKWGRRPAHHAARHERRVNRAELALLHHAQQVARRELERQAALDVTGRLAPLR